MKRVFLVWWTLTLVACMLLTTHALAQDGGGDGGSDGTTEEPARRYSLWQFIKGGGVISIPIWVCSGLLLALAIENGLTLRRHVIMPTGVLDGFNRNIQERKYQQAFETVNRSDSFLGRVLTAGLSKLPLGYSAAAQHMLEAG